MGIYRFRSNPSSPEGIPINPIHNRNRPSKSRRRVNRKESRYRGMFPKPNKLT